MIKKTEKVLIFLFCLAFLSAIALTVYLRLVQDMPGFVSLSNYSHSGNLTHIIDGLININTATVEQLELIPGIGQGLSQRIIEDRRANGPFQSTEDIVRVNGIGEKTYESIKSFITTGGNS